MWNKLLCDRQTFFTLFRGEASDELTCFVENFLQPTAPSTEKRKTALSFIENCIERCAVRLGIEKSKVSVHLFGSFYHGTYLPDGDVDITVRSPSRNVVALMHSLYSTLEEAQIPVEFVQAEVKLLKCYINEICIDVTFNQVFGIVTARLVHHVTEIDLFPSNLVKHSILLIKAWAYHETRVLGANGGLLGTYAITVMLFCVLNSLSQHVPLRTLTPLELLSHFFAFFREFSLLTHIVTVYGSIAKSAESSAEKQETLGTAFQKKIISRNDVLSFMSHYASFLDENIPLLSSTQPASINSSSHQCSFEANSPSRELDSLPENSKEDSSTTEKLPSITGTAPPLEAYVTERDVAPDGTNPDYSFEIIDSRPINIADPLRPESNLARGIHKSHALRIQEAISRAAHVLDLILQEYVVHTDEKISLLSKVATVQLNPVVQRDTVYEERTDIYNRNIAPCVSNGTPQKICSSPILKFFKCTAYACIFSQKLLSLREASVHSCDIRGVRNSRSKSTEANDDLEVPASILCPSPPMIGPSPLDKNSIICEEGNNYFGSENSQRYPPALDSPSDVRIGYSIRDHDVSNSEAPRLGIAARTPVTRTTNKNINTDSSHAMQAPLSAHSHSFMPNLRDTSTWLHSPPQPMFEPPWNIQSKHLHPPRALPVENFLNSYSGTMPAVNLNSFAWTPRHPAGEFKPPVTPGVPPFIYYGTQDETYPHGPAWATNYPLPPAHVRDPHNPVLHNMTPNPVYYGTPFPYPSGQSVPFPPSVPGPMFENQPFNVLDHGYATHRYPNYSRGYRYNRNSRFHHTARPGAVNLPTPPDKQAVVPEKANSNATPTNSELNVQSNTPMQEQGSEEEQKESESNEEETIPASSQRGTTLHPLNDPSNLEEKNQSEKKYVPPHLRRS